MKRLVFIEFKLNEGKDKHIGCSNKVLFFSVLCSLPSIYKPFFTFQIFLTLFCYYLNLDSFQILSFLENTKLMYFING